MQVSRSEKMKKIGFIGVGIMGKPMAIHLINAWYKLIVHDINPEPVEYLMNLGAKKADTPKETAEKSDFIITMLPDSPDVEKVILGENGVLEGIKPGAVIIDMSSISPIVSRKVASEAKKKGVEMLDAPVSGGEPGAKKGTLAIMVGGDKQTFDEYEEILNLMGKSTYVGEYGAGQTVKLANQIIVALNIAAVGEALVLGKKSGVDLKILYEAIRGGLAGSAVLDAKVPMILDGNLDPGFRIKLHQKDLRNTLLTASELNIPLPLTSMVQQMITALVNEGYQDLDHSAIVKFAENLAKIEIVQHKGPL